MHHNSGYDSNMTPPANLCPYVLIAYICGFDGKKELMDEVKLNWIDAKDEDCFQWVKNREEVINSMQNNTTNSMQHSLILIHLFG